MLTKADMEEIWRTKPVGYFRNNFCGAKSKVLRRFQVILSATKSSKLEERTLPIVWAKPGDNIMYVSDAHKDVNAFHEEMVSKYGLKEGEKINISHVIKEI